MKSLMKRFLEYVFSIVNKIFPKAANSLKNGLLALWRLPTLEARLQETDARLQAMDQSLQARLQAMDKSLQRNNGLLYLTLASGKKPENGL